MIQFDKTDERLEAERADILKKLQENGSEETLWEAIVLFAGYPFRTFKNLEFQYTVSGGEIFIDRKQKSKSITKSTVLMAYAIAKRVMGEVGYVKGPKKLETFGASYLYPIFQEIGVIVPEETEQLSLELD